MKTFQARPIIKTEVVLKEMKVDIIIPYHGQYQKLYKLMSGIWKGTKSNSYHIYLVDDCSPNATYIRSFAKAPWTTIIQNEKQLGFGGAIAVGFNASQQNFEKELKAQNRNQKVSRFVIFMHSDCSVEDPNWMQELIRTYMILENKNVGLVVARTDNPGEETNPLLQSNPHEISEDIILDSGYAPLYCALCERDLFKKIGGFIKPYPLGWYEDQELAYRMRKHGLKQAISGKSWVHHDGASTFNSLFQKNPKIMDIVEANRERCLVDLNN